VTIYGDIALEWDPSGLDERQKIGNLQRKFIKNCRIDFCKIPDRTWHWKTLTKLCAKPSLIARIGIRGPKYQSSCSDSLWQLGDFVM
jgi:hypothetical protein